LEASATGALASEKQAKQGRREPPCFRHRGD
jgi:hypothetical protein